ncbi:hypothetical protein BJ170DRAFT_184961 [Xylariales sp. AK1849]|nr:hypothetical protein BJ170DRAFT_184961 [Xylariales sp. AK1849]
MNSSVETYKAPETHEGIVTSWIPITTEFPTAPGCSEALWKWIPSILAAWDPGYGVYVDQQTTCLPKPVTTWWLSDRLGNNPYTVISLGPVTCPEAYYTATSSIKDSSSTFVACCPSNYDFKGTYSAGDTGQCTSKLDVGQVMTYVAEESQSWITTTSTVSTPSSALGIQVNGWNFVPVTATAANTVGETGAIDGSANPSNAQLSGDAIAGIGVGVSLGVIGLATFAAGILMMFKARRSARQQSPPSIPSSGGDFPPPAETDQTSYHAYQGGHDGITERHNYHAYEAPSQEMFFASRLTQQTYPSTSPAAEERSTHSLHGTEQGNGRTVEMEGEFERNIKVSFPAMMPARSRGGTPPVPSTRFTYA